MTRLKCYFYDVFKHECSILTVRDDHCDTCKFHKTAEEFEQGLEAAEERLRNLGLVRTRKVIGDTVVIGTREVEALTDE